MRSHLEIMRKTDRFVKGKKALFLAAACTALLLSACGGEEKIADPSVQNTEAQKETEAETTEAELPASTEAETSPQTAPETLSPFQNFMEYNEALVQANIQFETQIYTNRNHGISGGNTRNHLMNRVVNFFLQNL